jgi:chromosome condensin MukBEF MukE localization factor
LKVNAFMKNLFSKLSLILALFLCLSYPASAQQGKETPLTNAAVIKLVRAGFKEKTIIAIIRSRPAQFDLSPDRLIELKRSSVSENIILAMLSINDAEFAAGDEWSSDPFFTDSVNSKKGNQTGDGSSSGSTDIFGMSGGSNSRTQQRTGNGSIGGDTQTTGSATVRILRPPLEAGGKPELEKTPTLTNDSIVELVEAGFSEGTIIRRIENAPAEFDLSPQKLAELRRRRVSDRIIQAMTAAMGDESTSGMKPSTNTPDN